MLCCDEHRDLVVLCCFCPAGDAVDLGFFRLCMRALAFLFPCGGGSVWRSRFCFCFCFDKKDLVPSGVSFADPVSSACSVLLLAI